MKNNLIKQNLLGVGITNATQREILEYIFLSLENDEKPYYIVTPNPEMLVLAQKINEFNRALNQALLALPDGVGITIAGKFLGIPFKERVTGVDILEEVCKVSVNPSKKHIKNPITVGFLGGAQNVAQKTADCLREKYPGLVVGFVGEEWPEDEARGPVRSFFPASARSSLASSNELRAVGNPYTSATPRSEDSGVVSRSVLRSSAASIDILFVAFGFPKQEEWMHDHVGKISVKVMIGVGGAFDYISGKVSRAPKFIRSIGLEWLYRLIRQPWRWRRQLALLEFISLIFKERMKR